MKGDGRSGASLRLDSAFTRKYDIGKELGKGAFAVVYECVDKVTRQKYAVKIMDKTSGKMSLDEVHHEVEFMKRLNHVNIVHFIDAIESATSLYLVSEICEGGELLDRLLEKGSYTEAIAASVFRQLVSAVMYLHSKGIVHRDIKPDNILMVSKSSDLIKLSDFGLSGELTTQDGAKVALTEKCGTPEYSAPEVLSESLYDEMCDWWSVGVCLFILLIGKFPFHGKKMEEDIIKGNLVFPETVAKGLSKSAKDLILHLICVDKQKRYRGEDILKHPWMRGGAKDRQVPNETIDRLRSFVARRRFMKGINVARGVFRFTSLLVRLRILNAYRASHPIPPLIKTTPPGIAVVVGGTGSIGKEITKQLSKLGYHVIMFSRSESSGTNTLRWLGDLSQRVEHKKMDLSSCKSVFDAVAGLRKRNLPVNILIHAAGVLFPDVKVSAEGINMTLMVNLYGPFLFTQLLQDVLQRSGGVSRVVFLGSSAHKFADGEEWKDYLSAPLSKLDDELDYAKSKLGISLYAVETSRRWKEKNVSLNTINLGAVSSEIGLVLKKNFCASFLSKSCATAASHVVYLSTDLSLSGVTGAYFGDRVMKSPDSKVNNRRMAQKMWNAAAQVTDVYTWQDKLKFGVARWIDSGGKPLRVKHSAHPGDHSSLGSVTEANSTAEDDESVYYEFDGSDPSETYDSDST